MGIVGRKRKEFRALTEGEINYFSEFFSDYGSFLYSAASRFARNPADCDDIVQDAVLRLMQNILTLRELPRGKIHRYIVCTVRAAFCDRERREQTEKLLFLEDSALGQIPVEAGAQEDMETRMYAVLAVRMLEERLSARDWRVLVGRHVYGLSQEELGHLIGVEPNSVRMILHRARKRARKLLDQQMETKEKQGSF